MCVRRIWLMHCDSRTGLCFLKHVLTVLSLKCTDERLTSVPTYSLVLMFSRGFCCLADGTRSCPNPQPSSRSVFCSGLSPKEKTDTRRNSNQDPNQHSVCANRNQFLESHSNAYCLLMQLWATSLFVGPLRLIVNTSVS